MQPTSFEPWWHQVVMRLIDWVERTVGEALESTPRTARLCALITTVTAASAALFWMNSR
ncbi:hypothetical protein [Streptacidiphilus jiangxiensis]|nr:hypothetical protein [Streptacidiphilus jiangxiensis]